MTFPATLKNLCFNKSYFSDGLVTIRDSPITINEVKLRPHPHKAPKQSPRKKKKWTSKDITSRWRHKISSREVDIGELSRVG